MLNPAEEIVGVWLQDHYKFFVMSNVVVKKKIRVINGKNIAGGKGKEVDFLATDGKGKYFWVEVSVSASPRLGGSIKKVRDDLVQAFSGKFVSEKEEFLQKEYGIKKVEKWFVYSPKLFGSKAMEENENEKYFCKELEKRRIKAISFQAVLNEIYDDLDHMGYDSPRQYLYLFKKFIYSPEIKRKN